MHIHFFISPEEQHTNKMFDLYKMENITKAMFQGKNVLTT